MASGRGFVLRKRYVEQYWYLRSLVSRELRPVRGFKQHYGKGSTPQISYFPSTARLLLDAYYRWRSDLLIQPKRRTSAGRLTRGCDVDQMRKLHK